MKITKIDINGEETVVLNKNIVPFLLIILALLVAANYLINM